MSARYIIAPAVAAPDLNDWAADSWSQAAELAVDQFRAESSDHRPGVRARVMYDGKGLYGIFKVDDRYVRSVHHGFNVSVCKDSCVEFFFQPFGQGPYFNFEFNCSGSLLCYFITDHTRTPAGFVKAEPLSENDLRRVVIRHSLPDAVEPEITAPVTWTLGFFIPFAILEKYVGPIVPATLAGTSWRANFYKCADNTSHPHWAAWQPVGKLNFHLPEHFGEISFA